MHKIVALIGFACLSLARFGDRQGETKVLEDSACRVTVRPAHEEGRLGNDIYRYISGEGAAVRLGCRWCPPPELVQRLRDKGIDVPRTLACNSGVKWQVVYESNAWMRPDWNALQSSGQLAGGLQARAQPAVALYGYLQSWDYHKHHTSSLAFAQQAACDAAVRRACPHGGPDVSMHVRGTDAIASGIGPRPEHFLPHVHGCVVVVSDEPEWVKRHLPASVHYVHESPAIDMCVAGSGRHKVVLTAGTFDLFSAYFRRHRGAQVLMDPRTFRWDMLSGAEGERALASYAPREWLNNGRTTIVTAYYPIQSKHSKQEYHAWMQNMFSLRDPMVIYTTAEVARDVRRQRAHAPTRVVVRALADLHAEHNATFWEAQHAKDPERALHPDWRLYAIWQSKSWFLSQSAGADPFGTTRFAWVDVGYLRTPEYNDELLFCPSRLLPAGKVTMLDVRSLVAQDYLGGGFIGGDASSVVAWHAVYSELIEKGAKQGNFIGKDQPWMWRACAEHPGRCNIVAPKPYAGDPWFYMAAAVHAC